MRAAIYTRIAAQEAGQERLSLREQRTGAEEYARARGWRVTGIYQDTGYSGRRLGRPALTRLLADARAGAFDVVIVWRLDRLMSGTAPMLRLLERLERRGVSVNSVSEGIDTAAVEGRRLLSVGLAALGEGARHAYQPASEQSPEGKGSLRPRG